VQAKNLEELLSSQTPEIMNNNIDKNSSIEFPLLTYLLHALYGRRRNGQNVGFEFHLTMQLMHLPFFMQLEP
jgi:hypothetical protein